MNLKELLKKLGGANFAAEDMSFGAITSALQAALGSDPDGDGDEDYPWICDVFPAKSTFVYSCDGLLYEQGYAMDDDGMVALSGVPRQVQSSTSYLPVKVQASFSATTETVGDQVIYTGKVFEAGSFPDKNFEISNEELAAKASVFGGVDLDLEHSPFTEVLGNKLGRLEKLWTDGATALGRISVPKWLHEISGGTLKTSLSFDTAKNIVGCALTMNPRIPDAQVAAAFANFASKRHSASDMADIQAMHDLTVSQGAVCQREADFSTTTTTASGGAKGNTNMTLKEKLKALFAKSPEAMREAGLTEAELDTVEFNAPAAPAIDATVQAQLAEFKATNDRLIAGQVQTSATMFADQVIRESKAVPAQRDQLISLYRSAAIADGGGVVKFTDAGAIAEGANLSALRDLFKNAPKHSMFSTEIPNADPNESNGSPKEVRPDMVQKLRGATSLGQQTKKGAGN